MISNLRSDIEFRREKALELSNRRQAHHRRQPGDQSRPGEALEFIDPTTILKRRKPPITRAEREALRKLAEAL